MAELDQPGPRQEAAEYQGTVEIWRPEREDGGCEH